MFNIIGPYFNNEFQQKRHVFVKIENTVKTYVCIFYFQETWKCICRYIRGSNIKDIKFSVNNKRKYGERNKNASITSCWMEISSCPVPCGTANGAFSRLVASSGGYIFSFLYSTPCTSMDPNTSMAVTFVNGKRNTKAQTCLPFNNT